MSKSGQTQTLAIQRQPGIERLRTMNRVSEAEYKLLMGVKFRLSLETPGPAFKAPCSLLLTSVLGVGRQALYAVRSDITD